MGERRTGLYSQNPRSRTILARYGPRADYLENIPGCVVRREGRGDRRRLSHQQRGDRGHGHSGCQRHVLTRDRDRIHGEPRGWSIHEDGESGWRGALVEWTLLREGHVPSVQGETLRVEFVGSATMYGSWYIISLTPRDQRPQCPKSQFPRGSWKDSMEVTGASRCGSCDSIQHPRNEDCWSPGTSGRPEQWELIIHHSVLRTRTS